VEPYATGVGTKLNGLTELRSTSNATPAAQTETYLKSSMARLSVVQNPETNVKSTAVSRMPAPQSNESTPKESKLVPCMFLFS
jgi:hypothetical protein